MVLSQPWSIGGSCWAQAHGTHNAPIFPAGEGSCTQLEKKNVFDWTSIENSGQLMLVCSDMNFLTYWIHI